MTVTTISKPTKPEGKAQPARTVGGFRATLENAGLWELVQLKCETRARCVVCVRSGDRAGYLYFGEGRIVHALVGGIFGERAALEILGWRAGSWESCEVPWPARASITTPWQGLLLRAAQREDEAGRPQERASDDHALAQEGSGLNYRPQDFEHAVRIDAQGTVTGGHGRVEEFAALTAYVCRVGDLIGELMGTGKLLGVDAALAQGARCLILRKAGEHAIALRPRPGVDLTQLKQQLEL